MGDPDKTAALKVAYADVILNMEKEAASRVVVSEKRAELFQHQLDCSNKESIRLLLRLKHMIDVKTIEAETASTNQKRKIDELESQLNEAEDVIIDLRAELNHVRDKLERAKKTQVESISGEITSEDATTVLNPGYMAVAESETRNNVLNHGCCNAIKQGDWPKSFYPHNSDLATIVMGSEKPEMRRKGCRRDISAVARNLEIKHTNNGTENCGDFEQKTGESEMKMKMKPLTRLGPGSTLIKCRVEPTLNASNESSAMVDRTNDRLLQHSFHIRKNKKESLGKLNEKISEVSSLNRKGRDEEKENSLQEISKPNQGCRESRRLSQVARQLIYLSGQRR